MFYSVARENNAAYYERAEDRLTRQSNVSLVYKKLYKPYFIIIIHIDEESSHTHIHKYTILCKEIRPCNGIVFDIFYICFVRSLDL